MARYALAQHVFVCVNGEHLVLLDLKKDRYWALEASKTAVLGSLVSGWPVTRSDSDATEDSLSEETTGVIEVLRGRGLLAETIPPGKDATPVSPATPVSELVSETETSPGPPVRSGLTFVRASGIAKIVLRTWPFERVIGRVRRRKALRGPHTPVPDLAYVRKLVEAFGRYRIFLFSSKNECLYDSLALIEFLARHRVYPDWVFGVQTRPFSAHCWVQYGGIVFNDTVEHVSGYTPIMVV
jgi:Transglutaminase-like superfamily